MPCFINLFTPAELEKLDPEQLDILRRGVRKSLSALEKQLHSRLKRRLYDPLLKRGRARKQPVGRKGRPGRKRKS